VSCKVIGVIPARYGASRFPGKPLAMICGKPMIIHVYERAKQAKLLTDLLIATDDDRIMAVAEQYHAKAVMTRSDHPSGSDRIAEAVQNEDVDIVVNIQGDEPLIIPEMLDQVVAPLVQDRNIVMGTMKKKIVNPDDLNNPNVVKVVTDQQGFALYFSRSCVPYPKKGFQSLDSGSISPDVYKHLGIYVYQKEFLLNYTKMNPGVLEKIEELEQLRVLENGYRIKVVESSFETQAVDTPEDLIKVEKLMQSHIKGY